MCALASDGRNVIAYEGTSLYVGCKYIHLLSKTSKTQFLLAPSSPLQECSRMHYIQQKLYFATYFIWLNRQNAVLRKLICYCFHTIFYV